MRIFILITSIIVLTSCRQKQNQYPDYLIEQTRLVNKGLKELLHERISNLVVISLETDILKPVKDDVLFYDKNTWRLINQNWKEPDSLIYWRLTKSSEANKYNFQSTLDSSVVFGTDTLLRRTALLSNLNDYVIHIYQSYSYCGITFGCAPVKDPANPNKIHLYGTPHEYSELNLLVKYADSLSPSHTDTMTQWGTLILNTDLTN